MGGDEMRAKTVIHVEYEILQHILDEVEIQDVKELMVTDEHSQKRWDKGMDNVFKLLNNLSERRLHRLPKEHPDYREKVVE
jgi:hypothetical protein